MQRKSCSVLWWGRTRAVMLGVLFSLVAGRCAVAAGRGDAGGADGLVAERGVNRLAAERGDAGGAKALVLTFSTATQPEICGGKNGSVVVTVTNDLNPCQFSIDGGVTWQASGTFNNLAGGNYTVMAQEIGNPANAGSVGVAIGSIAGPTAVLQPISATCVNDDGKIDVIVITGTPNFQFELDNGPFGPNNLITGVSSGNHNVTIKDNNGCTVTQSTNVGLIDNLTLVMGPGLTVCQGTSGPLMLTTNATVFSWTPTSSLDNPRAAEPIASPTSTTTYTATVGLGVCTTSGTETITVLPAPHPTGTPAVQICYGQSTQLQGAGGVSYSWSPATYLSSTTVPNPIVTQPQKSITYSLTVTDANGCKSTQPWLSLVVVTPPPVVFPGDDTAILVGQTLPLDAVDVNGSGFTTYQWSPAIGLNNSSIRDPVATITADITYTVTATTAAGCSGTGSIKIVAVTASDIVLANAFTPNGDGRNDVLRPHGIGIKDFKYFAVFNRWGQRVFYTTTEGAGWDGMVGGQVQPMGTYVWEAVGLDFGGRVVERRGTVILVR